MSGQLRARGLRIYLPETMNTSSIKHTGGAPIQDYIQLMRSSKMWLSTLSPSKLIGTRYFEVMATGTTLLVTPPSPLLAALFGPPGQNYVTFETFEHLVKLLLYYSTHETERLAIVRRAQLHIIAAHSWKIRAKQVLQDLIGAPICTANKKPLVRVAATNVQPSALNT